MEPTTAEKSREKIKEGLKKLGKDPEKFFPKDEKPAEPDAAAGSSPEAKKAAEAKTEEERKEIESRAKAAKEADEAKKAADEKRLLDSKDEELSDEDKGKKKELLILKQTEKEAQKEARIQKRIDELVGQIKSLKDEKNQDKEKINKLESMVSDLKSTVDRKPEKTKEEARKLEIERIKKYEEEDKSLPRENRREMSKQELDDWFVEDPVSCNAWIADRSLRRKEEREGDLRRFDLDDDVKSKADRTIKEQEESRSRVESKYPDLKSSSDRFKRLREEGKNADEAREIIFKENPKMKLIADIVRENPEKYLLPGNGPELVMAEMEKRMKSDDVDREAKIREEAAEAERQRQANIDEDIRSSRSGSGSQNKEEETPLFKKQLEIWKKQFPKLTEAEVKARLVKRLKAGNYGV